MEAQVITVTSKGQIVIPVNIRKQLSIGNGDKLVAFIYGDTIMLKVLKIPSIEELRKSSERAQAWAQSVGFKEDEVNELVKSIRKEK